jgi:CheY-like chemotaxis protein
MESEVGKGSRFTVNLAIHQEEITKIDPNLQMTLSPPDIETIEQIEKANVASAKRGIVLLAEDNMANVLTIGEYLESHGHEVVVAHDGSEAIAKAEATNPDIILMDIQMPVLDGLEAIARLRQIPGFSTTPIIALTALAMPGDRERCLMAGASEYMSKPVSLKTLRQTVQDLLQKGFGE